MKKKIIKSSIALLILIGVFIISIQEIVNGTNYESVYDQMFSSNTITLNTDKSVNDLEGLQTIISLYTNYLSIQEYYTDQDNYSSLYLNYSNCDYSQMTCDFDLRRGENVSGNYTTTLVKTYDDIQINLNSNIASEFSFVKNNKIIIPYDETMFDTETEKLNYISTFIGNNNNGTGNTYTQYNYNSYANNVTKVVRSNNITTQVYIKTVDSVEFTTDEPEYSDNFKTLTEDGTITIKSDAELTKEIIQHYLWGYSSNNYYFSTVGEYKNNKIYIVLKNSNDSSINETHCINIITDSNIDPSLFTIVGAYDDLEIKADEPNTNKMQYIHNYLNAIQWSYSDESEEYYINYSKIYNSSDDSVYVVASKRTEGMDSHVIDFAIHKSSISFVGYDQNYSENYQNKLGNGLTVKSNVKTEGAVRNSLPSMFQLVYCYDEFNYCDIALYNSQNNTPELHKISITFDDSKSSVFKKLFNLDKNEEINIVSDVSTQYSSMYYFYNKNTKDSQQYNCNFNSNKCTLTLNNYYENIHEIHEVNISSVSSNKTQSYKDRVIDTINVYPGIDDNFWYKLTWNSPYSKLSNDDMVDITNCDSTKHGCEVAIINEDNNLEIHISKANILSGKSDEYKKVFPDDTVTLNAIYVDNDFYTYSVSLAYFMSKTKTYTLLENYANGKGTILFNNFEKQEINVNFEEPNPEYVNIINEAIEILDSNNLDTTLVDTDFINDFYYNDDTESLSRNLNSIRLNAKFKELITNKHINYFYAPQGGAGGPLIEMQAGNLILYYDGIAYGITSEIINTELFSLIYIPDDTENTTEAYIKAAQKRVDDYLGPNSGVIVSLGNEYSQDDIESIILSDNSIDIDEYDGNIYKLSYGTKTKDFIIIKDSSKMQTGKFTAYDLNNSISITTNNSNYPLNTVVSSKYEKNKEYEETFKKLGVDNIQVVDLDLYSTTIGEIKDFNGKTFEVSVPIDITNLDINNLYSYYIDDDGNVEEHKISVEDNIANFNTNHFSKYIISEKINTDKLEKLTNPDTLDNVIVSCGIILMSMSGLGLLIIYNKNGKKE